jgi:hypothetical protein
MSSWEITRPRRASSCPAMDWTRSSPDRTRWSLLRSFSAFGEGDLTTGQSWGATDMTPPLFRGWGRRRIPRVLEDPRP